MHIKVGDKIIIKKGMMIEANIPEKFINPEKPFSSKQCSTLIKVGDIYERRSVSKQDVLDEFRKRMDDLFSLTDYEIEKIIDSHPIIFFAKKYYTDYYTGVYTVTGIERIKIGDIIIYARKDSDDSKRISFSLESNSDIEVVS